jgi:DNA invertase Pin-like site-specific DNA recombinase
MVPEVEASPTDLAAAGEHPVRAGVYERVSRLASARDRKEIERARSIEEQNKANRDECTRYGWEITAHYKDPGLSASRFATRERPEYRRLLADINVGKLDVVVLWESSRGDRELAGWARFLNACRENGTRIYITTHGRLYDMANGRDWRNLAEDGVDSGYESEKTSIRVQRAVAAKMQAGEPFGHCPYGYEREYHPRTRELIEQRPSTEPSSPVDNGMTKAEVVQHIFRSIAQGVPVIEIRRWLNDRGIPAPEGGEWGRSVIQRIAGNPVYIGKRRWRRHDGLLDGNWPPIVDEETFWAVLRILSDPRRKTTRPGGVRHMLSFFASCDGCGRQLTAAGPGKKNNAAIYRCPSGCVHIRADWLDDYVSMTVVERLSRPDAYPLTVATSDKETVAARAEAAELRARLDEHADLSAEGKITPVSFARIERSLLAKIADAERRATLAAVPPVLRDVAGGPYDQVEAKWNGLPVTARKELCRVLFEQLSVAPRPRFRRPKRHRGRFEIRINVDGQEKFFGSYGSMEESIKARNTKYAELGLPVPADDASTPSWRGFNPERVTIKWREH